ncbi:MAG: OmpL47-type beta-barrel domain-containing protein, partial [Candidatus Hodarchaeales archaeon]
EGFYDYFVTANDTGGNLGSSETRRVLIDLIPPSTDDDAPETWQASAFFVNLTCSDDLSGCATTRYRIDNSSWSIGKSIPIINDGNHSIDYYSADEAGNQETTKTTYARFDTTSPSTLINAPDGWQTSKFNVTLDCLDDTSGCSTSNYRLDGGNWTPSNSVSITSDGNSTLEYYSIDNAGNPEKIKKAYVALDTTPPSIVVFRPDFDEPQYEGTNITWSCSGDDELSEYVRYMFRLRGPSTNYTWVTMRGYKKGRKWIWPTSDDDVGETDVRCVVKDLHGLKNQKTYPAYEITEYVNNPPNVEFLNPDLAEPQPANTNVTWSCLGNDTDGDLIRYMFRLRGPSTNDTWVTVRGFKVGRKWMWQTSDDDVGETDVKCVVKDYPEGSKANKIYHNYEITG